jgi:hypothetical protein
MSSTPLMLGPDERAALTALRGLASANPVDMRVLPKALRTPEGKAAHMARMTQQCVTIPLDFLVTFSIETGHPMGACRHMSISVGKAGRVPNEHAVWLVAEALGFTGGLDTCMHWLETLQGHGQAVNVVQSVLIAEGVKND